MKCKINNVNLIIFFFAILCLQIVLSQDYNNNNDENLPETPGAVSFAKNSRSFAFMQMRKNSPKKPNVNKKPLKKKRKFKRRPTLDYGKIFKEGWLSIASSVFKNTRLFPPIRLADGSEFIIKINHMNNRINSLYEKKDKHGPPGKIFFWFRLSGRHLYYSLKNDDINVLDNIYISSITVAFPLGSASKKNKCFYLKDIRKIKFEACAQTIEERNKWICLIQKNLGQPTDPVCRTNKKSSKKISKGQVGVKENIGDDDKIIEKTITQPVIIIPQPSNQCNEKWDYSSKGKDWECLCEEGKEQAPIDLPPVEKAIASAVKPVFEYEVFDPISLADFKDGLVKSGKPIRIHYLNHSLRIFHPNMGRAITLDGAVYYAQEIIFHSPAEHTIDGVRHDMEMQIIHRGVTNGDIAKSIILSLLFKKKAGVNNKFLDKLDIFNLPSPTEPYRDISESLYIPYAFLESSQPDVQLMTPFSFYTYSGSETQPPCTERTIMYVTSKPISIGSVTIEMFKEAIKLPDIISQDGEVVSPMFPSQNYRATQKLNGRAIFHYDHLAYCGPNATNSALGIGLRDKKRRRPEEGHYEKKVSTIKEYFYVNNETPSGLPGAYLVSPKEALGTQ